MKTTEDRVNFMTSEIIIQTIEFGSTIYIYIGNDFKAFNDLTLAMPTQVSSQLIGDNPTDQLTQYLTQIIKKPVLLSYNYSLESPDDFARLQFIKMFFKKRFGNK